MKKSCVNLGYGRARMWLKEDKDMFMMSKIEKGAFILCYIHFRVIERR
jgi:hypothetical protein